jgi:hypothetical protein
MDRLAARKSPLDFLIEPMTVAVVGSIAIHALVAGNLSLFLRPDRTEDKKQPGTVKILQLTPTEADRLPQTEPPTAATPAPQIVPPVYKPSTPTPPVQNTAPAPRNPTPNTTTTPPDTITAPSFGGNVPVPPPFKPAQPTVRTSTPKPSVRPATKPQVIKPQATKPQATKPAPSSSPEPLRPTKTPPSVTDPSGGLDAPSPSPIAIKPAPTPTTAQGKPTPQPTPSPIQSSPPRQPSPQPTPTISSPSNDNLDLPGNDNPNSGNPNPTRSTEPSRTPAPTKPAATPSSAPPGGGTAAGGGTNSKPTDYEKLINSRISELQKQYPSIVVKRPPIEQVDRNKQQTFCKFPDLTGAKTATVLFIFTPVTNGERTLVFNNNPAQNVITKSGKVRYDREEIQRGMPTTARVLVDLLLEKAKDRQEQDDRDNRSPEYLNKHVVYRYDILVGCK